MKAEAFGRREVENIYQGQLDKGYKVSTVSILLDDAVNVP